ncbi:MAG: DUF6036 family nucleotidyltransferase [Prosthecobacter sp.]
MHDLHPELSKAMRELMDKLDSVLRNSGYSDEPLKMYLAGGMAVHYHCGTRYTDDVDASFSRRFLLPYKELMVDYIREDQSHASIYLDPTYNDTFALLHPDHRESCIDWEGIGNERRLIHLRVFCPIDLAVSKLSRFSPNDKADILALAEHRYITTPQLRQRATEALEYYVGDTRWIHLNLKQIGDEIDVILAS